MYIIWVLPPGTPHELGSCEKVWEPIRLPGVHIVEHFHRNFSLGFFSVIGFGCFFSIIEELILTFHLDFFPIQMPVFFFVFVLISQICSKQNAHYIRLFELLKFIQLDLCVWERWREITMSPWSLHSKTANADPHSHPPHPHSFTQRWPCVVDRTLKSSNCLT